MRRRLEEDRAGQRSRISLGQARRSEFSGADLCLAGERRGKLQLQSDLVPPQRHLIHRDQSAPPLRRRGLFAFLIDVAPKQEKPSARSELLRAPPSRSTSLAGVGV